MYMGGGGGGRVGWQREVAIICRQMTLTITVFENFFLFKEMFSFEKLCSISRST